MFTGLIEELGKVKEVKRGSDSWKLKIAASIVLDDLREGDSIAVDGACLTVCRLEKAGFEVDLSLESLEVTCFKELKEGKLVNLERPLKIGNRLGGHLLLGHIDAVGVVEDLKKKGKTALLTVKAPGEIMKYLVCKGSVGVNGVSLTISKLFDSSFAVALIPVTLKKTNLGFLKKGEKLNLEADILGKYVERMLGCELGFKDRQSSLLAKDSWEKLLSLL